MEDMSSSSRYQVVELDFFGLDQQKQNSSPSSCSYSTPSSSSSKSQFQKLLQTQRTGAGGMQSVISKLNPQLLKNVINSCGATTSSTNLEPEKPVQENSGFIIKHESKQNYHHHQQFVASTPPPPPLGLTPFTSPLTIFYNGKVSVFDVPREKAEILMKLAAENGISSNNRTNTNDVESAIDTKVSMCSSLMNQDKLLETLNGDDLPIARKKSLQRFLAKRKERQGTASPYNRDGGDSVK